MVGSATNEDIISAIGMIKTAIRRLSKPINVHEASEAKLDIMGKSMTNTRAWCSEQFGSQRT